MTDEVPTPTDGSVEAANVPLSKAAKLEAKAARLREAEAAREAARLDAPDGVPAKKLTWWLVAETSVLVVALVLALVFAFHEKGQASDARKASKAAAQLDTLRASAIRTATEVSASFGTYDYQTLTTDFARTRSYLTPSFAADFSKLTSSLGALLTQDKGQTVGTVEGVGVTSVSTTTAVVIVFLDQKVTTSQSSTPRLDHNRLKLTLARQKNGGWLVSKLELK